MKPFHRSGASLDITRRDFLNGVLLGSGAALLYAKNHRTCGRANPSASTRSRLVRLWRRGRLCVIPREHTGGACSRTPLA